MSKLRSLFRTVLWAVAFTTGAHAAPALTDYLPAEALAVLHADNSEEARRLWKASPWARTWEDEQVQRFFAPALAEANLAELRENIRKETGKTIEEFLEIFHARFAIALTRMDFAPGQKRPDNAHLFLLLELGGKRALLEDMLRHGEHKNERTEEFRGIIITEEVPEGAAATDGTGDEQNFCHALIDDYWIAGMPKKAIQQTIVAIQQGGEFESLAKSPAFIEASRRVGDSTYFLHVNVARLLSLLQESMEAEEAKNLEKNPQGNPLGLTPGIIFRATGIDTIEAFHLGGRILADYSETSLAITFTEERGLTKLFAASSSEVALPRWIRSDWPKMAVLHMPVPHVYGVIEEIVQGLNPGLFTMMQGQLQMMQQNMGVDLKRDLIESLGGNLVAGYVPKGVGAEADLIEQGENLVAISATNPEKLLAAMESFGTMGGKMPKSMFEKREYLGAQIYSLPVNPAMPDKAFSFTVHDGWFLIATVPGAHPIEAVLQGLHQPDGPSLWDQPQVRQVMSELPPGSFGYAYHDMPVVMAGLCSMFTKIQAQMAATAAASAEPQFDEEGNEIPAPEEASSTPAPKPTQLVDPAQLPTVEMLRRYWSTALGANWHDAHSLTAVTRISHRPAQP